jgi:prepilin-type processing-associated H-X9-DG protein
MSLGCPIGIGGTPSSKISGSVTPSYLKAANVDYTAGPGVYNGPFGFDTNNMRFRHLNNTTVNALFVDGHVESRRLGDVRAKDICLNPA